MDFIEQAGIRINLAPRNHASYLSMVVTHNGAEVEIPKVLSTEVYPEEVDAYLSEAISTTIRELSNGSSLKQSAELAAKEGFEALTACALGFTSVQTMREHAVFLKTKASPEYREWLVSLVAIEHA
ncbi:MAG: hypothetical protein PHV02_16835 [Rhodocyclaceae bacterium]|nr:hypothetical protein [Rhodocyclaceae bacterium]